MLASTSVTEKLFTPPRHPLRTLTDLAAHAEKPVRLQAIQSLIRLNDPQIVTFFSSQLEDSDPDIVEPILWGLPTMLPQAAIPELIERIKLLSQTSSSFGLRKTADIIAHDLEDSDNYQQMRQNLTSTEAEDRKEAVQYFASRKDLSILSFSRQLLNHIDAPLRQAGVALTHALDDRDSLPMVEKLLSDPAPEVRMEAIPVIADWKGPLALDQLRPMLRDRIPQVRAQTIRSLSVINASGNFALLVDSKELVPFVHDPDRDVRFYAIQAILRMPSIRAKSQMVYMMNDPSAAIRLYLLQHVGDLWKLPGLNKKVFKINLERLTRDPQPLIRALAKQTVKKLGVR